MKHNFTLDAIAASGNTEAIKKVAGGFDREKKLEQIEKLREEIKNRKKS